MSETKQTSKIKWTALAFMAFSTVWGFGNITNGFVYFNGTQVIFSWIFMFGLMVIILRCLAAHYCWNLPVVE